MLVAWKLWVWLLVATVVLLSKALNPRVDLGETGPERIDS